jgi:DNA repair protein RadC
MKNQNRILRNGATRAAPAQAKTRTPAAPAEFKTIRLRECPVDSPKIDTPPEVVDFWRKHVVSAPWFKYDKECLCVFLLNTRHRLIGFESVCQGTLDTLLMHPREVLRPATVHNAAAIIIAHNHPSGDPTPSDGDIAATRDLIQAAEVLKIPLLDHIIIGDMRLENSFVSLRALGYFDPAQIPATAEDAAPGQILSVKTGRGSVCKEALAAISELEKSAAAVIALAMMNASHIKTCVHDYADWEDFESASFQAGNVELPRILADQFECDLSGWRRGEWESKADTENAVNALVHLVTLQGNEISNRNNNGAFACSVLVSERLEAAFKAAWKSDHHSTVARREEAAS